MTTLGTALLAWGAYQALIVSTSRRDHATGMHALIWGVALITAGSVR